MGFGRRIYSFAIMSTFIMPVGCVASVLVVLLTLGTGRHVHVNVAEKREV